MKNIYYQIQFCWNILLTNNGINNVAQDGSEYLNDNGDWVPFGTISDNVDSYQTFTNSNWVIDDL